MDRRRYFVQQVTCSENCVCPQRWRYLHLRHKGSSDIQQATMFVFCYTILLRCSRVRGLIDNFLCFTQKRHITLKIFKGIVSTKYTQWLTKLSFYFIEENFNDINHLSSTSQKINPSQPRKIINKNNKIPKTQNRLNSARTPNIRMNQLYGNTTLFFLTWWIL